MEEELSSFHQLYGLTEEGRNKLEDDKNEAEFILEEALAVISITCKSYVSGTGTFLSLQWNILLGIKFIHKVDCFTRT